MRRSAINEWDLGRLFSIRRRLHDGPTSTLERDDAEWLLSLVDELDERIHAQAERLETVAQLQAQLAVARVLIEQQQVKLMPLTDEAWAAFDLEAKRLLEEPPGRRRPRGPA